MRTGASKRALRTLTIAVTIDVRVWEVGQVEVSSLAMPTGSTHHSIRIEDAASPNRVALHLGELANVEELASFLARYVAEQRATARRPPPETTRGSMMTTIPKPGPGTLRERDQLLSRAIEHIDRASVHLHRIARADDVAAGGLDPDRPVRRALHRMGAVWTDLHEERERVRAELREVRDA